MRQLTKPALLKVIPLITVIGGILTTMYVVHFTTFFLPELVLAAIFNHILLDSQD